MRIIGGELRGRRIAAPRGQTTRPMLDRVREALFSTVADWLPDGRVLDLFAGSGSLGIESLSRGAAHVRMVERSPATAKLLARNVEELGLASRAEVVCGDALERESWGKRESVELVFLDPPYALVRDPARRPRLIAAVEALARDILVPGGRLVFHAPRGALGVAAFPRTLRLEERRYGTNSLWYVRAPGKDEA